MVIICSGATPLDRRYSWNCENKIVFPDLLTPETTLIICFPWCLFKKIEVFSSSNVSFFYHIIYFLALILSTIWNTFQINSIFASHLEYITSKKAIQMDDFLQTIHDSTNSVPDQHPWIHQRRPKHPPAQSQSSRAEPATDLHAKFDWP